MSIPIRNLYFLLVYAWDVLDEAGAIDVGATHLHVPEDLFAKILRNGIQHLLRRGLDRAYISETHEIAGIRGKIELTATLKRKGSARGRVVCTFHELTYDVLHNQLLKATLLRLIRTEHINDELRRDLTDLVRRFDGVSTISLRNEAFRRVQLHSNNRFYRFLLHVCQFLHHQMLPDKAGAAAYRFAEFSPTQLEAIFQNFVRNFFARHQTMYRVSAERLRWQRVIATESVMRYLPIMETDVSLESSTRKLVIETKFYGKTLRQHHHSDETPRVHSAHLYQLFAYLQNLGAKDARPVEGLLLYAQANNELFLDLNLFGHSVRIATIDLNASPEAMGSRLFECAKIERSNEEAARSPPHLRASAHSAAPFVS